MEEKEYLASQSENNPGNVTTPISFILNQGQVEDPRVKFLVKTESSNIYLSPNDIVFSTLKEIGGKTVNDVITSKLLDSNPDPQMTGLKQQQGIVSFFSGNDPSNWFTGVPTFEGLLYEDVYPNIDRILTETENSIKGDFIVYPGGNPQDIRLDYDGARRVRLRQDGTLVVRTPWGRWTESAPVAYQEIEGDRIPVEVEYILLDAEGNKISSPRWGAVDAVVGFQVGDYDPNYVLEIDPILEYSTYLGGSDVFTTTTDTFIDLETVIVTETVVETDPDTGQVTERVIRTEEEREIQGRDFIDTFELISEPGNDAGYAIAVDNTGAVYITGETTATNFPSTSEIVLATPIDPAPVEPTDFRDAFVTKLDANGDLVYSAYISGTDRDRANGIAVDSAGSAYIVGETESNDFPVINRIDEPFQPFAGGSQDAFVAKLNPTGTQFDYASYLGGVGRERGIGIFVNSNEFAYVTGQTNSQGLGTPGAFQSNFQGGSDAFIAKVNPEGSGLEYFTYVGGSEFDEGVGIAEDDNGEVYISGTTESSGLATAGAYQSEQLGRSDAFVTKLNADGSEQVYFTYIGGGGGEVSGGLIVDDNGAAYITGITPSPDFPTTPGAFQESYQGGPFDAYITKVAPSGTDLEYSTFIGGSGNEGINFLPQTAANIAVDRSGTVHVIGTTTSTENSSNPFPITTETAAQPTFGGGITDAFIIRFNPNANTENNEEDLIYSSYWGGGGKDEGYGIALDEAGAAYITGMTLSSPFQGADANNEPIASEPFPTTAGAYQSSDPSPQVGPIIVEENPQAGVIFVEQVVTVPNREDAFVSKFAFEGVVITEFGGTVEISEDGATDIYSLELAIQPTDSVRIDIASDDQSTVFPSTVTFTQADWDRPQRIQVTAVDDTVLEGPHESTITHSISSADPNYSIIPVGEVVARVADNEFEILVDPTTGLTTSEGGESDEFTVVLGNVPSGNVIIPISSLDPEEGLVSSGVNTENPEVPIEPLEMIEIVFTPSNWDIPQAVTVTGVDDDIEDGDQSYTIAVGPAVSPGNDDYDGLDAPDVSVTNKEFSIIISATELRTTEAGVSDEFTVVLGRRPTADVIIPIMSSNINEGLVSTDAPDSEPMEMLDLVFTPENWDTPQTVIVTGVDNPDEIENADVEYSITIGPAVSDDGNYNGQALPDIQAINIDLDSPPPPGDPGVIIRETASSTAVTAIPSTDVTEGVTTDTYEVVLNSPPMDNVDVEITIVISDEQTITAPDILSFTADNWSIPQIVVVGGVKDQVTEGPHQSRIEHRARSSDPDYNNIEINSITVNVTDSAGVMIESQGSIEITEGESDTYSLTLTRRPSADVTITIEADNQSITSPASVTFTPDNWNIPQNVVVAAVSDQVVEGNHTSSIIHTATSADRSYNGVTVANVTANISESNTVASAGISITESGGSTSIAEDGTTDTYMVVLDAPPTADVKIAIAPDDQSSIALNSSTPASGNNRENILTFTRNNWNVPQTVTVFAVDDLGVESMHSSTITHTVSSIDSNYDRLQIGNVIATITDNDVMSDEQFSLDIDGNDIIDAFTDGFLLLRYEFGFRGNVLVDGAIGSGARRQSAASIEAYLEGAGEKLDLDGNGSIDALKDGIMALRYIFGFTGNSLVNGLLGSDATRDGNQIEALLQSYDI